MIANMHTNSKAVLQLEASLSFITILNSMPLLHSSRVASELHAIVWK
jgi:hypothetical protein